MTPLFRVLCSLLALLNFVTPEEILPTKETDSPIFYYGFINNEVYQHYLPSRYSNVLRDRDSIRMSCNKGYTVAVRKASIIDLNEEENDYKNMAKEICSKKEQCQIDVRKFKRNTKNPHLDFSSELAIEYICMSSYKNLYDGKAFHQGNSSEVTKFMSISKALEACTLNNCKYVIWNDEDKRAVICNSDNLDHFVEKKNNVTYMNPANFYTPGYATFLNYMSICDHVLKSAPYNLSTPKSVDVCSHLDCDYFTRSNSPEGRHRCD
ncbi:hypothetical protein PCYB_124900, partial [Plasmodium cynomolgi strain B]